MSERKPPRAVYGESSKPEWIDMSEYGIAEPDWNDPRSVEAANRNLAAFLRIGWPQKYGRPDDPGETTRKGSET